MYGLKLQLKAHARMRTNTRACTHTHTNMRFTHSIQLGLMQPARTLFSLWPGWGELGKPFELLCSYVLYPFPLSSAQCLNYAALGSPHSRSCEMTWRVLEFYQNVCLQSRSDIVSDGIGLIYTCNTSAPPRGILTLGSGLCRAESGCSHVNRRLTPTPPSPTEL